MTGTTRVSEAGRRKEERRSGEERSGEERSLVQFNTISTIIHFSKLSEVNRSSKPSPEISVAADRRKTMFCVALGRQIAAADRSQPIALGIEPSLRSACSVAVFSNHR